MKILLVGSGGREHALTWRLANSERCKELYCAPGNPGIDESATCVDIKADDIDGLVKFAKEKAIDLVVVGPEGPLVAGLSDALTDAGIKCFGPTKAAARLEGSKGFTKDLCSKYGIPTAAYGRFKDEKSACEFIRKTGAPIVVKADGLAAGKGVIIAQTIEEAEAAVKDILGGTFGLAGAELVIEEFLDGDELSFFAFSDGVTTIPFTTAQDHKRVGDGDTGPNTGGMGAYSPAHMMTMELHHKILDQIIYPTAEAMKKEGCPFQGVFFAGIMVVKGEPCLIEYNVRFGDPECQAILLRLQNDLLDILDACASGTLAVHQGKITCSSNAALAVVMAAKGYPGDYAKGSVIKDIGEAEQMQSVMVFHAGTAKNAAGEIVSNGGRVLAVAASAGSVEAAQKIAYEAIGKIDWKDGFYRKDIGWRAVKAAKDRAA